MKDASENTILPDNFVREFYNFLTERIGESGIKKLPIGSNRYDLIDEEKVIADRFEEKQELFNLKKELKELLIKSFDNSIEKLKGTLITHSPAYDDIIALQSRYNRINNYFQKGLVGFTETDKEIIKIENAYIYIINNLEDEELKKKTRESRVEKGNFPPNLSQNRT